MSATGASTGPTPEGDNPPRETPTPPTHPGATPTPWSRITELFDQARDLPPGKREEYLDESCAGDLALRDAVLGLLFRQEQTESLAREAWRSATPDAVLVPGDVINNGRFRIVRMIGRGGMGEVYQAQDAALDQQIAIKTIRSSLDSEEKLKKRFARETALGRSITHPNICRIYDINTEEWKGRPLFYFTMELLEGETLSQRLKRGKMTISECLPVVEDIAAGLGAAHKMGIVHRDLKSSNVMLLASDSRRAVITDFGLARFANDEESMTGTGRMIGTLAYMAPEQMSDGPVGAATDVYSLGVVLFEMVTGCKPFSGESDFSGAVKRMSAAPPSPRRLCPDLDPKWDAAIVRCLQIDPADRFQSTAELVRALGGHVSSTRGEISALTASLKSKSRTPLWMAVLVFLALLSVAVWYWRAHRPVEPNAEASGWLAKGTAALRDGLYWKAQNELERAAAADPEIPISHARLAEAYYELDQPDKAQLEALTATSPDMRMIRPGSLDGHYLQAIHETIIHDFSGAIRIYREILKQLPHDQKAIGYVDLGRALERNGQTRDAIESYRHAIRQSSAPPAAWLHLGVALASASDFNGAMEAFSKAEDIYSTSGDVEGQAEVEFQRGHLLNSRSRPDEARKHLENAYGLAVQSTSVPQQIRAKLQLSLSESLELHTAKAQDLANEAISLAGANHLDLLTIQGQIDLANSLIQQGQLDKAREIVTEALKTAQRDQARYQENAARMQLANIEIASNQSDRALADLRPAETFFDSYRTEKLRCLRLKTRALNEKGDAKAAVEAGLTALALARDLGEQSMTADLHQELGNTYLDQEEFPKAIEQLRLALDYYRQARNDSMAGYAAVELGSALDGIGDYQAAAAAFAQIPQGLDAATARALDGARFIAQVESLLSKGLYPQLISAVRGADRSRFEPEQFQTLQAAICQALSRSSQPQSAQAQSALPGCRATVQASEELDRATSNGSRLALLEALSSGKESAESLTLAAALRPDLQQTGDRVAEWQCLLFAARAAKNSGNVAQAHDFAITSRNLLNAIAADWGSASPTYLAEPAVRQLSVELDRLIKEGSG